MSEISRHLPLSQRPRRDESAVTNDWTAHVAEVASRLADLLESAGDVGWAAPGVHGGASVGAVATALVSRLTASRASRAVAALVPRRGRAYSADDRAAIVAGLRDIARSGEGGAARRRLADLSATVDAAWDIANALDAEFPIDPVATGAVALARSLTAPLPIRSVVAVRRFVAVDADWSVGTGTPLRSTAREIVLFLFGSGVLPTVTTIVAAPPEPVAPADESATPNTD